MSQNKASIVEKMRPYARWINDPLRFPESTELGLQYRKQELKEQKDEHIKETT